MNPEDGVIDAIDKLVDEQLAAGPRDDYHRNFYPECDNCPHDWHGFGCVYCDCPCPGAAQPPYVDQIESVRYTDTRNGHGYTFPTGTRVPIRLSSFPYAVWTE